MAGSRGADCCGPAALLDSREVKSETIVGTCSVCDKKNLGLGAKHKLLDSDETYDLTDGPHLKEEFIISSHKDHNEVACTGAGKIPSEIYEYKEE